MSDKKPQVRAAKRGFLCARQLADIREMARIARTEGVPLNVHGVTIGGVDTCGKENLQHANTIVESAKHTGRGVLPTESEGSSCEKPQKMNRPRRLAAARTRVVAKNRLRPAELRIAPRGCALLSFAL